MCSFIVTNLTVNKEDIAKANKFSKNRGPDETNVFYDEESNVTWLHNLLHITGEKTIQPFVGKDTVCTFNGQIYNYKTFISDAKSDGYVIEPAYKNNELNALDGEFAIVIHDKIKEKIIVLSDTFATKPCWISIREDKFAISSYLSSNISLGFDSNCTFKTKPNTIYEISTKDFSMTENKVYEFNLTQNKRNFDRWCELFDISIEKRIENTAEKFFVGLSSGYDSGCIVNALTKKNAKFTTYSVFAAEDESVMKQRHNLLNEDLRNLYHMSKEEYSFHKSYIENNSEYYESDFVINKRKYIVQNDKGSVGTSFICSKAKSDGFKIYMSGHGSDEIYSDYGFLGYPIPGFEHCDIAGYYPTDLSRVFPWKNFSGYRMIDFAYKDESVGGSYGIEVRYPLIDRALVQEFLRIDNKIKNMTYKSPLHHYLKNHDYPFNEGPMYKVGFRANANLR